MKKRLLKNILIVVFTMLFIIMIMPKSFAGITPDQIKGNDDLGLDLDFIDKIADGIKYIGAFISVGVLMVIAIKYMTGSIEEKANYKKTMIPYIIGCVILFGASIMAPVIKDLIDNDEAQADIGNTVLGIIRMVGSVIAVGVLMILGIKYMLGSAEEKATYKKSMLPYVIGMVLLFSAVNIALAIYEMIPDHIMTEGEQSEYDRGVTAAQGYINSVSKNYDLIERHKADTEANYKNWAASKGDGEYYKAYLEELGKWLNENKEK